MASKSKTGPWSRRQPGRRWPRVLRPTSPQALRRPQVSAECRPLEWDSSFAGENGLAPSGQELPVDIAAGKRLLDANLPFGTSSPRLGRQPPGPP